MTYPAEVLNSSIRANGIALNNFVVNSLGFVTSLISNSKSIHVLISANYDTRLMVTFAMPYALEAIGWKTYMINGVWDVFEFVFLIIFWVEMKGKTLEEIDEES